MLNEGIKWVLDRLKIRVKGGDYLTIGKAEIKKKELKTLTELVPVSELLEIEIASLDEKAQEVVFNNIRHVIAEELSVIVAQLLPRNVFLH